MSHIFGVIDFSDLDDPNYDFKGAQIPVAKIINAKFNGRLSQISSGIKERFEANAKNDTINGKSIYECLCFTIGKNKFLTKWVTFAWDRGCEYLIAQTNCGDYVTMHRMDENYAFIAHKFLQPIIDWVAKRQPLIAFSGETIDKPVLLASRKLMAGLAEINDEIIRLAEGNASAVQLNN